MARLTYNIGDKYGDLTIIGAAEDYVSPKGKHSTKVKVRCKCGKEFDTAISSMVSRNKKGRINKCISCNNKINGKINGKTTGKINGIKGRGYSKYFTGYNFSRLRCSARNRGIPVEITIFDLDPIFESQNFMCNCCGIILKKPVEEAIKWVNMGKGRGQYSLNNDPHKPSVDRIDSNKGYIKDNIQILCGQCNNSKSDYTEEEFLSHCKRVVDFQKKKNKAGKVKKVKLNQDTPGQLLLFQPL